MGDAVAPKKGGNKIKGAASQLMESLGIRGGLRSLVRKAVVEGWSIDEFANALMETKAFRKSFPGIVDFKTGTLNVNFSASGAGASALLSAVGNYRRGLDDFQNATKNLGLPDIGKRGFAAMIRGDISLEEFGARATVIANVLANPGLRDLYNEQAAFAGMKPLDEQGFYRAIATRSTDFYDTYQAAYLRNAGLNLTAEQAAGVAKGLDSGASQNLNLSELVAQVKLYEADIGGELSSLGIGTAELALVAGGGRPDLVPKLQQLVAQRRAIQQTPRQQVAFSIDEGERGY